MPPAQAGDVRCGAEQARTARSRRRTCCRPGRACGGPMKPAFAIAPNFHLDGGWLDRLLVAANEGWRAPSADELAALVAQAPGTDAKALLFAIPAHMRSRFWDML